MSNRPRQSDPGHPEIFLSPNQETMETAGSSRSNRRKGRELALQALYQIEITGDTMRLRR